MAGFSQQAMGKAAWGNCAQRYRLEGSMKGCKGVMMRARKCLRHVSNTKLFRKAGHICTAESGSSSRHLLMFPESAVVP